ncbi:hypothetical protein ONE63_007266 [Megalurothrips usitatus]|uniref:Mannosyltransferase n=1 Tax=Megalurothrips usitatus TaxID=439358 RepID=A0AAV7XS85_9NEOP|nr:hypothetical protein ONE63_007266 [Megalurothrips usitatus]
MAPTLRSRQTAFLKRDVKKLNAKKAAVSKTEDAPVSPHPSEIGLVYPRPDIAFKVLLTARFCSAIWSNITDCDETYNFWEPSHYVLYGKGFQTWEYSPEYALRSYTYLMVNMFPAWLYSQLFQANRMLTFYFSRCLFAFVCAQCEVYFYKAVCREFGVAIGRLTLAFLLFSAGMFISSTAFLPSTFSMYMTLLSMAAWFQRKYELAILTTALSAFLSWPFAGLIGLPIAVDLVLKKGEITRFLRWSAISTTVIVPAMVWLDSQYYGRVVFAPFNIILYNVFTSHGPDLYGTEPWPFYFINCFLNFNFVAIFAMLTPFFLVLSHFVVKSQPRHSACLPFWLSLMPLYLWCFVFFLQPHKEERFLFPVYPLICLCGAVTVDTLQKLWFAVEMRFRIAGARDGGKPVHYLNSTARILIMVIAICSVFGVSRILTLYKGYHAPMDILMELGGLESSGELPKKGNINVCVGKEWYRFPSSFFLPSDRFHLQFLQSEFKGQLPAPYSSGPNATAIIPKNMNSHNMEEPSRYFPLEKCHFIIDAYLGYESALEPHYASNSSAWTVVKSLPFLNAAKSDKFFRAFYIPYLSSKFCEYGTYYLLKSLHL